MNLLVKCVAACLTLGLAGCATGPAGTASFSVVSKKMVSRDRAEVVAQLDVKMCTHNVLVVFAWGEQPNHEYLLRTALDEHHADALTNAHLDFTALPLLLYNQNCARLRGDLVRFQAGNSEDDAAPAEGETSDAAAADVEGGAE